MLQVVKHVGLNATTAARLLANFDSHFGDLPVHPDLRYRWPSTKGPMESYGFNRQSIVLVGQPIALLLHECQASPKFFLIRVQGLLAISSATPSTISD